MADTGKKLLRDEDLYLFHEGRNFKSYRMLGAHLCEHEGCQGVRFAVWAAHARAVRVVGNFNGWQGDLHVMERQGDSGVWALFVPGLGEGEVYKYEIITPRQEKIIKADPFAFAAELRPKSGSVVARLDEYVWQDGDWQRNKGTDQGLSGPMLIYEVHLGSWRRKDGDGLLTYRDLAAELVDYAADMGYTHVEVMPLAEHPYDGSWGYQATGYYAATSRYGPPQDLMHFVDCCHRRGIGVILDWVPGHFCNDGHGLKNFDGEPLFECGWACRAENYQWGTTNFDLGKTEVLSFLISNAVFWFDQYHIDGLRVDAVANMLYLDYARESGDWLPNQYGGRENIEAIDFIRKLNEAVFSFFPKAQMFAEESTAWPLVTRPAYVGGLGFNYKWNMGWMNDMLRYMETDPVYRKWAHNKLTFSLMYAFSENFVLPLSHDEVVHGKRSLLDKMPGDYWQKFANLRAFYSYLMGHPGKKLLFMGGEFGQFIEWDEKRSLDWHLLDYDMHAKLHRYVAELNRFYRAHPALWQQDTTWQGFSWIDCHDQDQSVVSFLRYDRAGRYLIFIVNFTPVVRYDYRIGVPAAGKYEEIFNSDRAEYGGSGQVNAPVLYAEKQAWHNQPRSLLLKLPPLAAVVLRPLSVQTTQTIAKGSDEA
ncbi:1,4-alpha-glucan branching protein GlgB [Acetonema longum]|uniref:1,4-alpha-glucan branching enzyme GlgB n=1 Tax=Acetonema longum DSM 6540 TaxID=1009370 RepID=F7NQE6_9FIRM|nr:1,4-alpha-glucan branching protein GlgB [Acetonema longum]EGO61724.1 1,4-alpha-glucan branching enzyme [Acetonema longum DSM 6540]